MRPPGERTADGRRWRPLDDALASTDEDKPPTRSAYAPPGPDWNEDPKRWAGQMPGEDPDAYPGATPFEMDELRRLEEALTQVLGPSSTPAGTPALPYCACGAYSEDGAVTMDPASFRVGPPGKVERPGVPGRPLRKAVDAWLAAGGWGAGQAGAGSLALAGFDSPEARNTVDDQWRYEMRCRGWEGTGSVRHRWQPEDNGGVRMYWWTTAKAPAVPPPPPEAAGP